MEDISAAIDFLVELGRTDLAGLLRFSKFRLIKIDIWDDYSVLGAEILSPPVFTDALLILPDADRRRIREAIAATVGSGGPSPQQVQFTSLNGIDVSLADRLLPEIFIQQNEMIAVAEGKKRIDDANDYYRARRRRIAAGLETLGLDDPNPHADLWGWHQKWEADFPSHADRRHYVRSLYRNLLDRLILAPPPPVPPREPTGWERVDRAVEKARAKLIEGQHEEDYQSVGLFCREVIISLGQAVYDPAVHKSPDGVIPSKVDGGRMIEAFLAAEIVGEANKNIRQHTRAALKLAVELQHKRTANYRAAALCAEATSSVVNILAILSGRRDP
jgi:hypothetical protein